MASLAPQGEDTMELDTLLRHFSCSISSISLAFSSQAEPYIDIEES
jgi:hypothetical protein